MNYRFLKRKKQMRQVPLELEAQKWGRKWRGIVRITIVFASWYFDCTIESSFWNTITSLDTKNRPLQRSNLRGIKTNNPNLSCKVNAQIAILNQQTERHGSDAPREGGWTDETIEINEYTIIGLEVADINYQKESRSNPGGRWNGIIDGPTIC